MAVPDATALQDALLCGDVSAAWAIWSCAAGRGSFGEAFHFAGGLVPDEELVSGRGSARFRTVRLEGPKVRNTRSNLADPRDGADVFCVLLVRLFLLCWFCSGG